MPIEKDTRSPFVFSFERALEAKKDINLRIDALESRLDNIARKVTINDHPVIPMILSVSHDEEELTNLGNAILRIAQIIQPLDELRAQKSMIDLAEKNPNTFVGMFGDFSTELDDFLSEW